MTDGRGRSIRRIGQATIFGGSRRITEPVTLLAAFSPTWVVLIPIPSLGRCAIHSAPKGRDVTAQGTALGTATSQRTRSPEGAKPGITIPLVALRRPCGPRFRPFRALGNGVVSISRGVSPGYLIWPLWGHADFEETSDSDTDTGPDTTPVPRSCQGLPPSDTLAVQCLSGSTSQRPSTT